MPQILPIPELRSSLNATYSLDTLNHSKGQRILNIQSFLAINRDGLRYASLEHRILLYTTLQGERIYIQLPGKESSENNRNPMPMDFRPKLQGSNGNTMQDASFGFIWDILDEIGRQHRDYLSIIAALFFRMGYLYGYDFVSDSYKCSALKIHDENIEEVTDIEPIDISWLQIGLSDDVWFSLNNYFGDIPISSSQCISFEAFIKFVDLLLQNEDCKYYYRNVIQSNNPSYNLRNGRTSTCDANLLILFYLQGHCRISTILNSFQKSRGVPPFRKSDYHIVTDGIVV